MIIDKKAMGIRLKRARKSAKLSQEQLANLLYKSKDSISKWEQGVHAITLPDIDALATILNVSILYFIGDEETDITMYLEVKNADASKPILYKVATEVCNGLRAYYKDKENAVERDKYAMELDDIWSDDEWCNDNSFLVLVNKTNRDIVAIRDFGMYLPTPFDFLFTTEYVPVRFVQPTVDGDELIKIVEDTLSMLDDAIKSKKEKKPLFLLRYCGMSNYIAWSLAENKHVCVYDCKQYKDSFSVSSYDTFDIKENTDYCIIYPSKELINRLKLELYPEFWEQKKTWDKWEYREEKEKKDEIIPTMYKETYNKAIKVLNFYHANDIGCDYNFEKLEERTHRLERLCELNVPMVYIHQEIILINDVLNDICDVIKM